MNRTRRPGRAVTVVVCGVLGLAVGLGGASTLALWSDSAQAVGETTSGYEYFAAARVDAQQLQAADDFGRVPVTITVADAQKLEADKKIAIPFVTESLSQGNKGLAYQLTLPKDWGAGVFGASTVGVYWVDKPESCVVGGAKPVPPATVEGLSSVPVDASYSVSTKPVVEYWCLTAQLGEAQPSGEYENTATVTGNDPSGAELSATDSWHVQITKDPDYTVGPPHTIMFGYNSFRPAVTEETP
ncbi:SipW-dependent-type signal peptide-containing protein [Leucobacter sp. HY1908]